MQETTGENEIEQKNPTNWSAWYWGLMIFLAVQIVLYLYITNHYTA